MKQKVIHRKDNRLWTIRIVAMGDGYGLEDRCIHDEQDPLIEFYDLGFQKDRAVKESKFGPRGQFVSRYYLSDLISDDEGDLDLSGGVSQWWADENMVKEAVTLARLATE